MPGSNLSPPIKSILFDFDGTLVDTEPSAVKATQDCFKKWKIELDPKDSARVTGVTWNSAFEFLFKKYPIPLPKDEARQTILDHYRKETEKNLVIVPGCVQAVRSLCQVYLVGLVSGSDRADILRILDQLGIKDCFRVILGAEDYPKSKPAPDGYLKAASLLHTTPRECLVFEDSAPGILSARSAGMWVVAITSTNHFSFDLSQAHFKVPDLSSVNPAWISNLSFD